MFTNSEQFKRKRIHAVITCFIIYLFVIFFSPRERQIIKILLENLQDGVF